MTRAFFAGLVVALICCAPVRAQRSTWQRWKGTETPAAPSRVVPQDVGDFRLAGVLVELDLLADPVTCPYGFEAHVEAGMLYLSGQVPSRAVHDHAVLIAHQCWPNIVDGLTIQGNPLTRAASVPAQKLQYAVLETLQQAFPHPGHHFEVRCDASGRIEIKGGARTLDQKLAVSQRVRLVPGCACVINMLRLNPAVGQSALPLAMPGWNRSRPTLGAGGQTADTELQFGTAPARQGNPGLANRRPTAPSSPYAVIHTASSKTGWAGTDDAAARTALEAARAMVPSRPEPRVEPASVSGTEEPRVTHATVLLPDEGTAPTAATVVMTEENVAPPTVQPASVQEAKDEASSSPAQPANLKERIARTCGLTPRDVQVVFTSPKEAVISLPAAQQSTADLWVENIMQLPEFDGVHVQIQVNAVD